MLFDLPLQATVILGCRNVPAGEVALNRIIGEIGTPVGQVQVFQLDLGCFASIRTFVYHLRTQYDFVDTLICNAGVWVPMDQRQKTSDGFELHFGVNHLGHFYLAKLLLEGDNMISDRIILVSSSLMARDLDVNRKLAFEGREPQTTGDGKDKKKTSKWVPTGYEDTKLMNALLSTELDRRLKSRKDEPSIGVYSCCPGFCSSNLGRHNKISSWKRSLLTPIFFVLQRSPERGSHNILYLALEDKQRLVSGGFYKECKLDSEVMKRLQDLATQGKQLYDLSEELIAEQNRGKNVGPHLPQY